MGSLLVRDEMAEGVKREAAGLKGVGLRCDALALLELLLLGFCAPIAPYRETRRKVRAMVEAHGGFIEVHVATPLETCEGRDRKGLYAKARAGIIKEFTGISDPYEPPEHAELVIDTRECTPLEAAQMIVTRLEAEGFIR